MKQKISTQCREQGDGSHSAQIADSKPQLDLASTSLPADVVPEEQSNDSSGEQMQSEGELQPTAASSLPPEPSGRMTSSGWIVKPKLNI